MRDQISYLPNHLKSDLMDYNSFFLSGDPRRMSDKSFKALLSDSDGDHKANDWEAEETEAEWTDVTDTINYLPLVLHPSPTSLLRKVPSLSAVTLSSLNLSYCMLGDMDRLVTLLPPTLRELGLCGVRFKGEKRASSVHIWKRGLSSLARKLIVLTVRDQCKA